MAAAWRLVNCSQSLGVVKPYEYFFPSVPQRRLDLQLHFTSWKYITSHCCSPKTWFLLLSKSKNTMKWTKDVATFKDLIKAEVISLDSFVFLNYDILSREVISNLMLRRLYGTMEYFDWTPSLSWLFEPRWTRGEPPY